MYRISLIIALLLTALIWPENARGYSADETASIPVLRQDLPRGALITERDLRMKEVPARRLRGNFVQDTSELIGLSAKRRLRAGQAVRETDVEIPALVERNAIVTLVLKSDTMVLTSQGRAQERGIEGAYIRILNSGSMQVVEGRVVGQNLVEVLPTTRAADNAGY